MDIQRLLMASFLAGCSLFLWGAANCTNATPVAADDSASNTGQLTYVDVLANDTDADGELLALLVTGGTCQAAGTVTVEDRLIRFQPSPAVPSACTITYRATDFQGNFDTATLTFSPLTISLIFADDFESGTLSAWDSCTGC